MTTVAELPVWGFRAWEPHPDSESAATLMRILESWDGTKYAPGQQCRGVAVDCVGFVGGVLDELTGRHTPIETLPPDTAFHAPDTALAGALRLRELYQPNDDVTAGGVIQPGDVLVTGPRLGGPMHAMIVGPQRNTVWHSSGKCVHRVGTGVIAAIGRVFMVYRLCDRTWRSA